MSPHNQVEISKSALSHADGLIQWTFLLNGAAAAGLLTFLGNSIDNQASFKHWDAFSNAIVCFGVGLLFAVASRLFTFLALNYFSQLTVRSPFDNLEDVRVYLIIGDRGNVCALVAFAFFVASCIAFVAGVLVGRYAIFG
jgi:hypothetical protein